MVEETGREEEVLEMSGVDLYQNVDTHMSTGSPEN